jgi:hypothetical protein
MSSISALQTPGIAPPVPAKAATAEGQAARNETTAVANTGTEKPVSPAGAYPTSRIAIDPLFNGTIVETLNPTTGEVVQQVPTREVVRRYEETARRPVEPSR